MSKVKIQGNASGTGVLTIEAPNTNTNRTLTLPDTTGTLLDTNSSLSSSKLTGALPAIDGSALTGISGGITDVSKWGTSAYTASGDINPVTGWTEENRVLGSAMTHSGGVFTFPSTGIWEVSITTSFYKSDSSSLNIENVTTGFYLSTDGGSTWSTESIATGQSHFDSPGNDWWRTQVTATVVVDITNTTTHKIKPRNYVYGSTSLYIANNNAAGGIWFKRLGDT